MDYNNYMDPTGYGPFLKYALKFEHTRKPQPPEYVYELPLEIEIMIFKLSGIEWWRLSKKYFSFFSSTKPFGDIMMRLERGKKHNDMLYYINSVGKNKLKDASPLNRFKFYLYKYGYEVCIGGLGDMLHLFLKDGITPDLCKEVVKTFSNNNIDLIPEFVANCYFLEVEVSITPELAHTLFYNSWGRCNFIHHKGTQDEITTCLNTMFDSIDFVPETNDLCLMFLLLNMSGSEVNDTHVKLMKRILSMINNTSDPSEQLAISLEIPFSTVVPNTKYQGFPNKLRFGYIEYLIEPILSITPNMLVRIMDGLKNLQTKYSFSPSYQFYKTFTNNISIINALKNMISDITDSCIYVMVCDTYTVPIKGWDQDLYFKGCRELQKLMNPFKIKVKTKLLDTDYTYVKYMTDSEIITILDRTLGYVSIYGIKLIFEVGLLRKVITSDDLTSWIIRTYHNQEWLRTDEYDNDISDVIIDYMKIVNQSNFTSELINLLCTHQYIQAEHYRIISSTDIKYEIIKRKLCKYKRKYYTIPKNDELVDMILEKQEPIMINQLFNSCSSYRKFTKEYLYERIQLYNKKHER